MTTYVDDRDLDAAQPLRALVRKVVRTQFAAKDPVQMQTMFLVLCVKPGTVPPRAVVFDSLWVITHRRSWKTLWDSVLVRFVFAPLLDSPSHRLIPSYGLNSRVILVRASSLEVCCSCHIAHASTCPLSPHGLPDFVTRWYEWARKEIRHIVKVLLHTLLKGLSS